MQVKKYNLVFALIILFISNQICLAQENKDTDISREVFSKSTFMTFKDVKDNFGKKFAQSYFVVQVKIRNEEENKQFIVQKLDVFLDPTQCRYANEYYRTLTNDECKTMFDKNFAFADSLLPIRSEEVLATGKADLNRSNRNVGFRLLAFTANMGTILTGFNGLIGRDGILGINVLGTTATAAANALFPNTANEKLENLRNALPGETVIIPSKDSRTINIFIPTEKVFWKDSWKEYTRTPKESSFDIFKFKKVLDLILISSATGVLVDNDAPKVEAQSDDDFRKQTEKIIDIDISELQKTNIKLYAAKMQLIELNLNNSATEQNTTASLRKILTALMDIPEIKAVLVNTEATKKINAESKGSEIYQAIRVLTQELFGKPNGEELTQQVRDIVIAKAR